MSRHFKTLASIFLWIIAPTPTIAQSKASPAETVKAILERPAARLDYLDAAKTFDGLIDKTSNIPATNAMVARLVDASRQMAGPNPSDSYKLSAMRQAIYVAGAWNYNRAFSYDLDDPFGRNIKDRLLSTYVQTRKGNCVSMPALFLIVADKIGLDVHLSAAPLHLFIRYTDPSGIDHNLEPTSGGHEARAEWMRQHMPMSDRSIASGFYMRTLTKRETIAEMATTVMDYLLGEHRYQEAIDVADAILAVNPRDAYTMVKKGSAFAGLLQVEFIDKYPNAALIPATLQPRYQMLAAANAKAFKDAEALGWEEPAQEPASPRASPSRS